MQITDPVVSSTGGKRYLLYRMALSFSTTKRSQKLLRRNTTAVSRKCNGHNQAFDTHPCPLCNQVSDNSCFSQEHSSRFESTTKYMTLTHVYFAFKFLIILVSLSNTTAVMTLTHVYFAFKFLIILHSELYAFLN